MGTKWKEGYRPASRQTADIFLSTGVKPLEGLRPFPIARRATLESTRLTMRLGPEKARPGKAPAQAQH